MTVVATIELEAVYCPGCKACLPVRVVPATGPYNTTAFDKQHNGGSAHMRASLQLEVDVAALSAEELEAIKTQTFDHWRRAVDRKIGPRAACRKPISN